MEQIDIPDKIKKMLEQYPDMNVAPLYSARGLKLYIDLVKMRYNFVDIDALLKSANMKIEEINDPGYWFNQNQINAFMDYLIEKTNNPQIGREAGSFFGSPESLGILRSYYKAFGTPLKAFQQSDKLAADISLSASYQSKILSGSLIEITATPYSKRIKEKYFQCDNRIGYFEGIFKIFNLPLPQIEHEECLFKGYDHCKYTISWKPMKSDAYKRAFPFIFIFALISSLLIFFIPDLPHFEKIISAILVLVGLFKLYIYHIELKEYQLILSDNETSEAYSKLFEEIQKNYQNLEMMKRVSMSLSRSMQLKESLQAVINVLKDRYDRCAILLANEDKSKLIYEVGYGYTEKQLNLWRSTGWFHILPDSKGTFIRSFRENKPFLINDIKDVFKDFSIRSVEFTKKMGVKSLLCCPIYYDNQAFGILAVDNHINKKELIQSDTNLLMGIAYQIGIRLHYYKMHDIERNEALTDLALQTVHRIKNPAAAIDTNIKYLQRFCKLDEKSIQKIASIHRLNARILEIARNYLQSSRPIQMKKEKIHVNDLFNEIISNYNGIKIKYTTDLSISYMMADKSALKSIFEELIENSKKYGKEPFEIKIKKQNHFMQIEFKDNGHGIPENIKHKIFGRFFSGNKQETGLGLFQIRRSIEEHGGTINLLDDIENTCFIIQLPY